MDDASAANSLSWVNVILNRFPPALQEAPARRPALQRLDDIFHMQTAPDRKSVQAFFHQRLDKALDEMEQPSSDKLPRIWKLYNAGFVVRSGGVTIGFDLIPQIWKSNCQMTDEEIARLVAQVDVIFISHEHQDHANSLMAQRFLQAGKPVLVPTGLWADQPFATKLTYPQRDANSSTTIHAGKHEIAVTTYPGHQSKILNNVYFVRLPDGFGVVHTGDQYLAPNQSTDRVWLDRIGDQHKVGALLVDCWYDNIYDIINSTKAAIVLPGHEDELSHTIDHREDYAQTYERFEHSSRPYVVMTWGESLRIDEDALRKMPAKTSQQ